MSSVTSRGRQVSSDVGYYIPIASMVGKVYAYNATTGASTFSTASWCAVGGTSGKYLSTISTGGGAIMRDMGRTIVSASRTFRKVQLVVSSLSTNGVGGPAGTTPVEDYLTGYIELGFDGTNVPAPVAHYGR